MQEWATKPPIHPDPLRYSYLAMSPSRSGRHWRRQHSLMSSPVLTIVDRLLPNGPFISLTQTVLPESGRIYRRRAGGAGLAFAVFLFGPNRQARQFDVGHGERVANGVGGSRSAALDPAQCMGLRGGFGRRMLQLHGWCGLLG